MLEIAIIICIALILFIVLRNFPKTALSGSIGLERVQSGSSDIMGFWDKIIPKGKGNNQSVIEELDKDKGNIIAPVQIDQAQKSYNEEDPEVARILLEADQAFEENDLRAAEDLAIEALSKEKKCAGAYVIMGKIAQHRGVFEDAKEAYKTAIKCDRESGEGYFGLGIVKLKEENFSEAIHNLQKAVSMDRGVALWHAELGRAYMEVRQFAKAAKSLKRATSLDMENKEYRDLAIEAEEKQRTHSIAFRK